MGGGFAAGRMMNRISFFYLTFTIHLYTTVIVLIDIMHYIYAVRIPRRTSLLADGTLLLKIKIYLSNGV